MSRHWQIYYYVSKSGENPVRQFLDSLSVKQQTKILRIFQYIKEYGLSSILPHTKKLTGTPLWEIRFLGKDNIRIVYVIPLEYEVVILHGFIKKTQKTSKNELIIALKRYKEWNDNH